jgi:hypothetical protein
MLKFKFLTACCAVVLFASSAFLAIKEDVNAPEKKAIKLFNGKDLTGWKINGTENGTLKMAS